MKRMSSREIRKKLLSEGWIERKGKGDHVIFTKEGVKFPVCLPHPKRDLPIGTLSDIFKKAGWKK